MATFKKISPKKKFPVTITVTGDLFPLEREAYVSDAFKQTIKIHTLIASAFTHIQLISQDIKNISIIQNMDYPAGSVPLLIAWAEALVEHLTLTIKMLNECGDVFNVLQDTMSGIIVSNPTRDLTITAETENSFNMLIRGFPIANVDKRTLSDTLMKQITSKLNKI